MFHSKLAILQREEVSLHALMQSVKSWLIIRYSILQIGKRQAINAAILFYYFNPHVSPKISQILDSLLNNGIDLRQTSNNRKCPKDKSRRLETAFNDLEQMGILSRDKLHWTYKVKLRKDWLTDKLILEKMLKEINPNLTLKVGGALDGIFTDITGGGP